MLAVDYSFARPDPAVIRAAGYRLVMRYLGADAAKRLTRAEAAGLHAHGLGIGLVWENGATRAASGHAAGVVDATMAAQQARDLGYPAACPIFFAVDYDATLSAVLAYFQGVHQVLGDRAGAYGSYTITRGLREAGLARWGWQAAAWSGGRLDTGAHLYQRLHMTHPVPGCDEDAVLNPFPTWTSSSTSGPDTGGVIAPVSGHTLRVWAWNVRAGNPAPRVLARLRADLATHRPDVVILTEAYQLWGRLTTPGYSTVIQGGPTGWERTHPRGVDNGTDVALLVRDGVRLLDRQAVAMTRSWTGPDAGRPQSPRRYQAAILQTPDQGHGTMVWAVMGTHFPTGDTHGRNAAAVKESRTRVRRWIAHRRPGRSVAVVGDFNTPQDQLHHIYAGMRVTGGGAHPDHALLDNIDHATVTQFGGYGPQGWGGSDHPAWCYTLTRNTRGAR